MQSSYHLNASDLNQEFLDALKTLYKDKEIEIVVTDIDETAYLLKSTANQERLLSAIENVENRSNLVEINLEEFE